MQNTQQLIYTINNLHKTRYIKKIIRDLIIDNLEPIKENLNNEEKKNINSIISIVSQPELILQNKKKLIEIIPSIINTIKKYEEEYNDESNEDDIEEDQTPDEIEQQLDEKIPKYNGFNVNHPMESISYDKSTYRYDVGTSFKSA